MKTSVKILVPLLAIVTFAACSDLFNRGNSSPELTLNTSEAGGTVVFNGDTLVFEPYGPSQGDTVDIRDLPPFQYGTEDQNIVINGYYYAASGGWTPEGIIKQEADTITINVQRPSKPQPSTSMPVGYLYNAYISNVQEGNYIVRIIHQDDLLHSVNSLKTDFDTVFTKEIVVE